MPLSAIWIWWVMHNSTLTANSDVNLQVNCALQHWNKRIFVGSRPALDVQFAKQTVMTDKSLRIFSVFVSLPVRHFTLELISYVAGSIIVYIKILYFFLSYPACKPRLFRAVLYFQLWPVWLLNISPHSVINGTIFWKKFLYIICVFWFIWNVILRRIQGDIVIHAQRSLCKVLVIFVRL
jgi:hypothetical protein